MQWETRETQIVCGTVNKHLTGPLNRDKDIKSWTDTLSKSHSFHMIELNSKRS